ncbi:nucleotidyl transferase AbiEii/AbiGii toxin family protein [Nocardia farcinica]|uniref:nucleotidyl transferase AbiEii/AbiGii toxin family protein n=1 Tax=Nocardia farcinica TaxID=37329 RepID=UPI003CC7D457
MISDRFGDRLHFIGETALSRTHLISGRLSEDIDLVALGSRTALAADPLAGRVANTRTAL